MNGHEKRSAFYRTHREWQTDSSQPSTNSVTSSMTSCETSNDRLSGATSFGAGEKFLCPKAISECPEIGESSSISSSAVSSDKLSYSHDNGPTTDASTPDGHAAQLLPLARRSEKIGELRKSSDEEDAADSTVLLRRKKISQRRPPLQKRRYCVTQQSNNLKSPSYPSSMTSEYRTSSTETLSECGAVGKPQLRKILLRPPKNNQRKTIPKNIEPPRKVNWNKLKRGKHGRGPRDSPSPYFPTPIPDQHRLLINVSGRKFEVDSRVLDQHPETLLGNRERRMQFYDRRRDELFLDRHRGTFDAILDFYEKDNVLRRPDEVPLEIFLEELKFYSFDYDSLEDYLRSEDLLYKEKIKDLPKGKTRRLIWQLFEDSDSSWYAKAVVIISALVITLSVVVFCLETLPEFESLSHNVTESVHPGLFACNLLLNKISNPTSASMHMNGDVRNYHSAGDVPILQLYNFTEVFDSLIELTSACQSNAELDLLYRYMAARCWLQLYDVSKGVEAMLKNCTVTPMTSPSVSADSTKHKLRHSQMATVAASTNQPEAKRKRTRITSSNDDSDVIEVSRAQVFQVLHQLCPVLDTVSQRSQYGWFVLEAKMGSPAGVLFLIETGCIVWFLIELVARFTCCPDKKKFFKNFLNLIDIVAILPYFITLIVTTIETRTQLRPQTATILRTIRLIRMLRILKLSRYSRGFRILGLTLLRSSRVLSLLVCFQMVLAVLFSSIAYFAEYGAPGTQFRSIPESFWWALITMTTVGYGDIAPITLWGKITGACCAVLGILCISFPVPVIVSNFSYLYNQDKDTRKLRPQDLMWKTEEENERDVSEESEDRFEENRLLDDPPTIVVEQSNSNKDRFDGFRNFAASSLCYHGNNHSVRFRSSTNDFIRPNQNNTMQHDANADESKESTRKRKEIRHTVV